jgi:DNA modification methylase
MPSQKVITVGKVRHPEASLSITYRDIEELTSNPHNARVHSAKQIRQLAHSIKHVGFNCPVLIDRKLNIIAGHGRVKAAKLIGIRRLPTICLDHLNETQIRAFTIADNRLAELATWDENLLVEQLKLLQVELNFDLEATGFETGEIDMLLEGRSSSNAEPDPADEMSEVISGVRVARRGDIWSLGRHRLICGDALDRQVYSTLMENRKADAVFTDPPYNDVINGFVTRSAKTHHAEFGMASGEMSRNEFVNFLRQSLSLIARHCKSGALSFVCMDWRHAHELLAAAEGVFTEFKNLCVWVKESGGLGSFYRSAHELVFLFKVGKDKHRNNVQLGQHGRCRTNIWEYPRVTSLRSTNAERDFTSLHPTVKPVRMVADALLDASARGEIILDPFLGSGTTLIAAERVGRVCYGIELAPPFVDLIIRRWQALTGSTASNCKSGQSFQEQEGSSEDQG